ncbi:hypothetical protein [Flexithrix dorotheae]|uniref:hypothetical protein n=1 Tax=Flexithrix dorotheae TaxID=70993 RepID=UPI000363DBF6|nr:hypothetical protein [Flexithrix dorotheae]
MNFFYPLVFFCVTLIIFFTGTSGQCQENDRNYSISFVPQYLLIEAIRIDVEKEIREQKNAVMLGTYIYKGTTDRYADQRNLNNSQVNSSYQNDEVSGLGIESLYKFFMVPNQNASPYLAAGLGFHHIKLKYLDGGWTPVERDGLEYLELVTENQEETINRLDIIGLIGYKQSFKSGFLFDFFIGPVLKNSQITNTQNSPRVQDNPLYHYGFDGVTLRTGFSLGMKF